MKRVEFNETYKPSNELSIPEEKNGRYKKRRIDDKFVSFSKCDYAIQEMDEIINKVLYFLNGYIEHKINEKDFLQRIILKGHKERRIEEIESIVEDALELQIVNEWLDEIDDMIDYIAEKFYVDLSGRFEDKLYDFLIAEFEEW